MENELRKSLIKQACVRSLSCEVCPEGREGCIYFGDNERGHVLSCTFVLKDSKARGFQRIYSILVISQEKCELIQRWDFFSKQIERIVKKVKEKAKKVYEEELAPITGQEKRSIRLLSVPQVRGRGNTQRSSSKARSIVDLTGNGAIFGQLHSEFSWLLIAASKRIHSQSIYASTSAINGEDQTLCSNEEATCSLRQFYNVLGRDKFRVAAYHCMIGNQIIVRSKFPKYLRQSISSLSHLLPSSCVSAVSESPVYEDSWKYNLIGVLDNVVLPPYVSDSEYHLLIDVEQRDGHNCRVTLHSKSRIPDRLPNFIVDLERILQDMSYSDQLLHQYLLSLKEEWLNRARMVYSFTKGVQIQRTSEQMNKLFVAIGAQTCDARLLYFWMSKGLSLQFKSNVVAINSGSPNVSLVMPFEPS